MLHQQMGISIYEKKEVPGTNFTQIKNSHMEVAKHYQHHTLAPQSW